MEESGAKGEEGEGEEALDMCRLQREVAGKYSTLDANLHPLGPARARRGRSVLPQGTSS